MEQIIKRQSEELDTEVSHSSDTRSAGMPTSDDQFNAFLRRMNLIGESYVFKKTMQKLARFSISHAPILLEGETGTGKELAARALHYLGKRKNKPFIPVNCGAFPESMFENELFGHDKGAYTDAKKSQPGLIELAHTGTLFLDEKTQNWLLNHAWPGNVRELQNLLNNV